jgi:hypothetical protein
MTAQEFMERHGIVMERHGIVSLRFGRAGYQVRALLRRESGHCERCGSAVGESISFLLPREVPAADVLKRANEHFFTKKELVELAEVA